MHNFNNISYNVLRNNIRTALVLKNMYMYIVNHVVPPQRSGALLLYQIRVLGTFIVTASATIVCMDLNELGRYREYILECKN